MYTRENYFESDVIASWSNLHALASDLKHKPLPATNSLEHKRECRSCLIPSNAYHNFQLFYHANGSYAKFSNACQGLKSPTVYEKGGREVDGASSGLPR